MTHNAGKVGFRHGFGYNFKASAAFVLASENKFGSFSSKSQHLVLNSCASQTLYTPTLPLKMISRPAIVCTPLLWMFLTAKEAGPLLGTKAVAPMAKTRRAAALEKPLETILTVVLFFGRFECMWSRNENTCSRRGLMNVGDRLFDPVTWKKWV